MSYITREDGEHFVIPSYRDVLSAKQKSVLKRDIQVLSQSYGEYITLQRKNVAQYEVAFSPDTGYLLGESIWHHFKRPLDMVYCEIIPNTTEAILVIVKAGSVYLDGSFPLDSIPEELVIFLTQQNNFEIYTYGDVPISQTAQEGKFSFEANSIKSYTVLEEPVFPTLPLLKMYRLQLVDVVLKEHGIGVFPLKRLLIPVVLLVAIWLAWSHFTSKKPIVLPRRTEVNPYIAYNETLMAPAPDQEIRQFLTDTKIFFTMPGWQVSKVDYAKGNVSATVLSSGGSTEDLIRWGLASNVTVDIQMDGIHVTKKVTVPNRSYPKTIYPIKQVLAIIVDRIAKIYPGNHLKVNDYISKGAYTDVTLTLTIESTSPVVLALIGDQFKDLPLVLRSITLELNKGSLQGSIMIEALGN